MHSLIADKAIGIVSCIFGPDNSKYSNLNIIWIKAGKNNRMFNYYFQIRVTLVSTAGLLLHQNGQRIIHAAQ